MIMPLRTKLTVWKKKYETADRWVNSFGYNSEFMSYEPKLLSFLFRHLDTVEDGGFISFYWTVSA